MNSHPSFLYEFICFVNDMNSQKNKATDAPVVVAANYKPWLGPFTNTGDDLVNKDGEPLHFGVLNYNNASSSTFHERVKPRDVKATLTLLSYLYLEHHTIEECDSLLFDSSMLLIKASTKGAGVHFNSIGKPNTCLLGLLLISCRCQFCLTLSLIIARCWLLCPSRRFLFLRHIRLC